MMSHANRIRILLFSNKYPPAGGGVGIAGYELANAFSSLGHDVVVLTTSEGVEQTGSVGVMGIHDLCKGQCRQPDDRSVIHVAWRRITPQIVVINGVWDSWGDAIIHLARQYGVPVVYRSHGASTRLVFDWACPPCFGICHWIKSFITVSNRINQCKSFAQVVFLSSREGWLRSFDRRLARIWKLTNVSDIPNTFQPIRIEHSSLQDDLRPDCTVFLCAATFSPLKGQHEIIKAIKKSTILNCRFMFIAPSRNRSAELAESLAGNDSRFIFRYGLPRHDVIEAHNACDCVLLYSTHEQQPLVLLEAMSCQKPWICTNVGSVAEMCGGIVLKKRRAQDLLQAIKTMQSPDVREQYGQEGYAQWKSAFSPESIYARWDRLLADVAAQKPTRGGY